ncbi:MAG: TMEM43 family protein [Spirochaetota bacterium]
MSDQVTVTSNKNVLQRLGESIGGILLGFALFLGAFPALFMNEGRAVDTARALAEMGKSYTVVDASSVNPANEGKLVYVTGNAATKDIVADADTGISMNAIKLRRTVEMYQWEERAETRTQTKLGGGEEKVTTYTYTKGWSSSAKSSSSFHLPEGHQNPEMMFRGSGSSADESFYAGSVSLGAFRLSDSQIRGIGGDKPYFVSDPDIMKLRPSMRAKAKANAGMIFLGYDPANPQVGDHRIKYTVVTQPVTVSLMAQQTGTSFTPYISKNKQSRELISTGLVTPEQMILTAQKNNMILTWVLRFLFAFMMISGLSMISKPLQVLAGILPPLGAVVGAGLGIVTFLVGGAFSLITIAIAWVFFRPIIGITLIAIAVAAIIAGFVIGGKKKSAS